MEKWEEGYYITAMAGSATGSSLVVMSKGTPYTQQSYKVSGEPACLPPAGGRSGACATPATCHRAGRASALAKPMCAASLR